MMMGAAMRELDEVRRELERQWSIHWTDWLDGGGEWPLSINLKPPTESVARTHWNQFLKWRDQWASRPLGGTVVGEDRAWPTMGRQFVPERLTFASANDVASSAGQIGPFERANARFKKRIGAWPGLDATLRALAPWMSELDEADYSRLVRVVDWLLEHPDSGLYLRQLPIAGIDTKWIERHKRPILRLLSAHWRLPATSLSDVAGLKSPPARSRLRLLDPSLRSWCRGISDLEIPLDDLRLIDIPARLALVVENNVTALACTDLPGTVLIMGGGLSVAQLGTVPWLERIPILYWGDIDTWGFQILASLRRYHEKTISCLMDEATLQAHLWLRSEEERPASSLGSGLTEAEAALAQKLLSGKPWGSGLRIEQERLDWATVWPMVVAAVASLVGT